MGYPRGNLHSRLPLLKRCESTDSPSFEQTRRYHVSLRVGAPMGPAVHSSNLVLPRADPHSNVNLGDAIECNKADTISLEATSIAAPPCLRRGLTNPPSFEQIDQYHISLPGRCPYGLCSPFILPRDLPVDNREHPGTGTIPGIQRGRGTTGGDLAVLLGN
jgi:hypothetical protein